MHKKPVNMINGGYTKKILPLVFLGLILIFICIYLRGEQSKEHIIVTIATRYIRDFVSPENLDANVEVCEIYSDGSCRYYRANRRSNSLTDRPFLVYGSITEVKESERKIPEEELMILLKIYNNLNNYEYLYEEPIASEVDAWILSDGVEYKINFDKIPFIMMGIDIPGNEEYVPNDWEIKLTEFFSKFFSLTTQYWFSGKEGQ